jgi:hypothetical protein
MPPKGRKWAGEELPHRHISPRKRPIENSKKGIPGVSRRGDSHAPEIEHSDVVGSLVAPDLLPTDRRHFGDRITPVLPNIKRLVGRQLLNQ